MKKTMGRESDNRLAVSLDGLAGMLGCGRSTATKIGTESGARIQVGKRVLYRVAVVERYLEALAGE